MKILLVQPFRPNGLLGESWPPIGLGYLATSLRNSGHHVQILDCLKDFNDQSDFMKHVKTINPELIGINLYSISVSQVRKMVRSIKAFDSDKIVVLGGPHVSSLPGRVYSDIPEADYAIRGEGEIPIKQLVGCLEAGTLQPKSIPGLIFRENGHIVKNDPVFPKDIDQYEFPAWDLINPKSYFNYTGIGKNSCLVFFSRGCPFSCTFCAAKVTSGDRLRRRSLSHIIKELRILQRDYGITRFIIEDEGFGVSKQFIMEFCRRIKTERIKATFSFGIGMRLDQVDVELLETLKKNNFDKQIVLGIESGSERILKLMKKNTNLKLIKDKVHLIHNMGFTPNGYFILGYPGETRKEMKKTIRLAMSLPIREASFTAFQPFPGTESSQKLIEDGELPMDYDFSREVQNSITYAPKGMTPKELEKIRRNAILKFYLRPQILSQYFVSINAMKYAIRKFIAIFLKSNVTQKQECRA